MQPYMSFTQGRNRELFVKDGMSELGKANLLQSVLTTGVYMHKRAPRALEN